MTQAGAFDALNELARHRFQSARERARAGQRVIGYLGAGPIELICAGGFAPLCLATEALANTPRADAFMEDLFDPTIRSVFERILACEFDFLSAIILPRSNDSAHRLYYYLCEIARSGEKKLPPVLLFDVQHVPTPSSRAYTEARLRVLKGELESLRSAAITDAELHNAIESMNRLRTQVARLSALRCVQRVDGETAAAVFTAIRCGQSDEAAAALHQALDAVQTSALSRNPTLVLAGAPPEGGVLHAAIAAAGGDVVADFHAGGDLFFETLVDTKSDPITALGAHYCGPVATTRAFPADPQRIVAFAKETGARGVVFFFPEEEEALTWEFPAQERALKAAGFAVLCLSAQKRVFDAAAVTAQLKPFVAQLTVNAS